MRSLGSSGSARCSAAAQLCMKSATNPQPISNRSGGDVWVAGACRLGPRRQADALDKQPQGERHLEREHRKPHERGEEAAEEPCEPQGKAHHEQDRCDDAEPGQWDGDHSTAQEEVGEERAAYGEEGCGESHVPLRRNAPSACAAGVFTTAAFPTLLCK